ncbi:gliding motility lipoprotein GldK [Flavobacterium sp. CS20]|uniref:type IX secretion system lipoprotein PorK/GldK n=1 Tax=Flavobacterium sp. CS20 TaxID=2775246 RepID=UPI001B3A7707|nr:gliding motility lipoprotein GldK [Flavobacterium sp. CS20]QTY28122.1 gliding motility lipoprotein GldK [Flavobacterium sp. CS20]
MKFKFLLKLFIVISLLVSCSNSDKGQLVGVQGKQWFPEKPYGMVKIEGGSFTMGKSDYDIAGLKNAPIKTMTVTSFYMDETEITNSEYRQFTEYVRDSVIRQKLAEEAELAGGGDNADPNQGGGRNSRSIQDFAFKSIGQNKKGGLGLFGRGNNNQNQDYQTPYQQYSKHYDPMDRALNWDVDIIWKPSEYPDENYVYVMDEFYLDKEDSYNGERMLDVTKFVYSYKTVNLDKVARSDKKLSSQIVEQKVPVYPDTTVWIKDFNYSYNEPMHNNYFYHTAFDNYPVVGVSWVQAKAFSDWRTQYLNTYNKEADKNRSPAFRLPSEAEWEYVARGGLESASFPWGSPYTKDDRACYLANFKPLRGDYAADEALYTVEADAYQPNDYGLYNMSGNVAEWVNTSYDPSSYEYMSSINPNMNNQENNRKVIRGGSWKDVSYFLRVSTRDYEYADSARSYIGFRTVQDYLGSGISQNRRRN